MASQKLIAVKEFCLYHQIQIALILELESHDLVELVWVKRTSYIPEKNLPLLEKILRLYNELDINTAGIQTILQLLHTIESKEIELQKLRNQLEFYKTL